MGVLTPLRGTRFSIIKSYPTVHLCNRAPSCQDEALHIVLHYLPSLTSRDAACCVRLYGSGGGFWRCTLRHYFLTQISVWSGFKFQSVFLSPLTLHRKTLFASSSSQSSQRYYFPFVTPLRSPVACNCDLFCASVNSKLYYLQPSTLNVKHSTFFCVLCALCVRLKG